MTAAGNDDEPNFDLGFHLDSQDISDELLMLWHQEYQAGEPVVLNMGSDGIISIPESPPPRNTIK